MIIPAEYKTRPVVKLNEWVAALKNPVNKQCQARLAKLDEENNIVGECCLGVYCRVMDLEFDDIQFSAQENKIAGTTHKGERAYGLEREVAYLPHEVIIDDESDPYLTSNTMKHPPTIYIDGSNVYGPEAKDGKKVWNHKWLTMSELNDGHELSFKEIAFIVEHLFHHTEKTT